MNQVISIMRILLGISGSGGWNGLWRVLVLSIAVAALAVRHSAATDLGIAKSFFAPESGVVVEEASGAPPSALVRAGDGRVLGYAFSTRDVSGSVGYSGHPLDVVAAMTPDGVITGATIVAHEEPILVIGIPREALATYVANFRGFDVRASEAVRAARGATGPPLVAGASVTSAVIRDAILRSRARPTPHPLIGGGPDRILMWVML